MNAGGKLFNQPDLIPFVKDTEILPVAEHVGMFAKQSNAERVEGGEGDLLGLIGIHRGGHTLAHFACSLVGECHGQNGDRINSLGDKPGNSGGQHACLSSSCAG